MYSHPAVKVWEDHSFTVRPSGPPVVQSVRGSFVRPVRRLARSIYKDTLHLSFCFLINEMLNWRTPFQILVDVRFLVDYETKIYDAQHYILGR